MEKCIYSLKRSNQATFDSQEHIIPACIGGIQKLPKGYVSDETNNMFSSLERSFSRDSMISISRTLLGPGKRGSLNIKKSGKSKVVVFEKDGDKEISLGVIRFGIPEIINQIKFKSRKSKDDNLGISFSTINNLNAKQKMLDFIAQLEEYKGDSCIIKSKEIKKEEYILGFHEDSWFLGINENENLEYANEQIINDIKAVLEAQKNGSLLKKGQISKDKSKIAASYILNYNINDYYRIIAKIAFNFLAYKKGHDYILNKRFDPIRDAIYTGYNIGRYISTTIYENKKIDDLLNLFKIKAGPNLHLIMIVEVDKRLIAFVFLYGANPTSVLLENEVLEHFDDLEGLVCDWEHKQEIDMIEYLSELSVNK